MTNMLEVIKAIEDAGRKYKVKVPKPKNWRSPNRQWDRIIRTVCTGCGRPLGRYENENKLAFCYQCRRILFPETMPSKESWQRKKYY